MRILEVGVGLDLVEEDDAVRLVGVLVAVDGEAVVQRGDADDLHGGEHGNLQIFLGDAELLEMLLLALAGGAGVAAHGREDEGLGAPGLELVADGAHHFLIERHAAAAGGNADALAVHACDRGGIEGEQLLLQGGDGIFQILIRKVLTDLHHLRDHDLIGQRYFIYFRKLHILFLLRWEPQKRLPDS